MSTCDRKIAKDECETDTNEDKIYVYSSFKQFCLPVPVCQEIEPMNNEH